MNCGPKGLPTDTNLLYHQERDGTFRDVSVASGIAAVRNRYSMTAAAADFDGDGWADIYVASDSTAAILYHNSGDGTFTDVALPSGVAFSENGMPQAGMGLAVGDFNADGRLDLLKTHFADDIPALYRSLGNGLFEDAATAAGLGVRNRYVEWGAGMPDLDNDGWPDVFYVTGNVYPEVESHFPSIPIAARPSSFEAPAGSAFEDVTARSGSGVTTPRSSRGAAFGDFDNDGDIDVLDDEHERAARAAAQRPRGLAQLDRRRARRRGIEPVRDWGNGHRDCRRPHAGPGRLEPVQLLLGERPAPALRARRCRRCRPHRGALAERRTIGPVGSVIPTRDHGQRRAVKRRPTPQVPILSGPV